MPRKIFQVAGNIFALGGGARNHKEFEISTEEDNRLFYYHQGDKKIGLKFGLNDYGTGQEESIYR